MSTSTFLLEVLEVKLHMDSYNLNIVLGTLIWILLFPLKFNTFRSKNAVVNIRSRGDKCLQDAITCGISSYFTRFKSFTFFKKFI